MPRRGLAWTTLGSVAFIVSYGDGEDNRLEKSVVDSSYDIRNMYLLPRNPKRAPVTILLADYSPGFPATHFASRKRQHRKSSIDSGTTGLLMDFQ